MAGGDDRQTAPIDGLIAVVDIGSNSIRLVVFDARGRALWPIFNEKVLCGLGRDLAVTGALNPEGVGLALTNLVRFTRVAAAMGVGRIDLLATAAVREACDGAVFVAEVERITGHKVRVLDGQTEARLSALGVLAGFPDAEGVMGDLGGGSLELVELVNGGTGRAMTLPLGPFQLMATSGGNAGAMRKEVDHQLEAAGWLDSDRTGDGVGTFYPVGGAWRTLARIHIAQSNYPLHVVHGYTISRRDVDSLVQVISRLGQRSLARIQGVTRRRLETLPAAAVVLSRVLRRLGCKAVSFSAFGLREGHVYDSLSAARQEEDPLLAAAADIAAREARFAPMGDALFEWTAPLFAEGPRGCRRLQHASCLLSDIAWREHPDYRASQALQRVLYFPFSGVTHAERVFIAYASFIRYGGAQRAKEVLPFLRLLPEEMAEAARVLGLAQRLAYRVSGATRTLLVRCRLTYGNGELCLMLPGDGSAPGGEAVERRLENLAEALGASYWMIEAGEATRTGTGS